MTRSKRKNLDGDMKTLLNGAKNTVGAAWKDSKDTIGDFKPMLTYLLDKWKNNKTNQALIISIIISTFAIFVLYFTLCGLVNTVDTCEPSGKEKQLKLNRFRNSVQVLLTFIPLLILSFTLPSHHATTIFRWILLIVVISSSLSSLILLGQVGADNSISGVLISILVLIAVIAVLIAVFYGVNNKEFFNKTSFPIEPAAEP